MTTDSIASGIRTNLYLLPHEFFTAPNFINRFARELQRFIKKIGVDDREDIKNSINAFYAMCDKLIQNKKDRIIAQQLFLETFLQYASYYDSAQTYQNIIKYYEKSEFKAGLFSKFPYQSKYTYAAALFSFYQLSKKEDGSNYNELTDYLLIAKHQLLRIYSQFIEGKIKLKENQLGNCLSLLAAILGELSRWFEPIYYIEKLDKLNIYTPNMRYVFVLIMVSLRDKTCLNYNGLLLLKVIDDCNLILSDPNVMENQKEQIRTLKLDYRNDLRKNNLKITELRKHQRDNAKEVKNRKGIVKYFVDNDLYLTEHAFYCKCKKATIDNLSIKTSHTHTQSAWCAEHQKVLDSIKTDYITARSNLYCSLDGVPFGAHINGTSKKAINAIELKNSFLSLSFKTCYSILDKIGAEIFKALGIEIEKYNKNKKQKNNIYFLNMWDLELITDEHYLDNFYLVSLRSIAKDLDSSEYSALREFKFIRNKLEHDSLIIIHDEKLKGHFKETSSFLKKDLIEKTLLLLMLTKSAMLTFTYF
jgi:hypothetical protein